MKKIVNIFKSKKFLLITIPVSLVFTILGFVLGFLLAPTKYEAHTVLFSDKDLGNKTMGTITGLASSDIVTSKTLENLNTHGVKHSDGTPISNKEITSGIRTWYSNTSDNMDFYFKSTDRTIVCEVSNALVSELIEYLDETNVHVAAHLFITSYAEYAYKLPIFNKISFFVSGPILGFSISFITFSIFSKELYVKTDIDDDTTYCEVEL